MTIQQVNFYRNKKDNQGPLSFQHCAIIAAVILAIFIGLIINNSLKIDKLKLEVSKLEGLKEDSTIKLEEYSKKYPMKSLDLGLQDVIDKKKQEKQGKKVLIDFFSQGLNDSNSGFSKYLTALSERHTEGLWLTKIELTKLGKSISLTGSTLKPEILPEYISELGKETAFSGTTFAMMRLGRPDKDSQYLNFTLTSEYQYNAK